ncbi:XRE family transcriptional regulator [Sphingomonas sp. Root710]|uniref:helix-turn-helix domain-containing protein n=1 Tax=Sphingomonas sp. Root710 TaxID=1736594 RepID=UPI000701E46C|nr:XRE family transcriptional regulator [Sphingomonas sp. Root710]KRB86423.1 XRE family transcriptional regulator [Sphingomonas sp. Root710]
MVKQSPPADETGLDTISSAPQVAERSLERALGIQIRQLRRQHDLSVSDLASAAGISNGMLSKIENGGISASLSTLQGIAVALNVPLSSLFASCEERQDCSYVPAGQGLTIERRGTKSGHVYQLLGHVLRGDVVVEPYLILLRENAVAHTSFRHSGVEYIFMIEGEVIYRHGSERYTLREGDSLLFDSGALHGPETLVSPTSRYLSIIIYPRGDS